MSEPICAGPVPGDAVTTLGAFDLAPLGYMSEEWWLDGVATSRRATSETRDDGLWETEKDEEAPYKTRLIVCRPSDPTRSSGTVVVEWLNVSGGGDGSPDWFFMHRQLMRTGAIWVGVSAQKAGIDGGGLLGTGSNLKAAAPERYDLLSHPGDTFAYDIYTQAGTVLRRPDGVLAGFPVETLLAVGESQSAVFLVTYVNAFDHDAAMYDGFLIHGRGSSGASLDGNMFNAAGEVDFSGSQKVREDARVPVITVQSETDLIMMNGIRGRQRDSDKFRWWEVAGSAHFDSYGLIASQTDDGGLEPAQLAALLAPPDEFLGMKLPGPVNSGPQQHYVLNAAISHLDGWVRHGTPPPEADRIASDEVDEPVLVRDGLGIAKGGIRTPWVDAPVAVLSGAGHEGDVFTAIFGSTRAFDEEQLTRMYPGGRDDYMATFEKSANSAIEAGFILADDRDEIIALGEAACPIP
jgi:Alpha/beta hydrolase domain